MKSIKSIITISLLSIFCSNSVSACPFPKLDNPQFIKIFRICSPGLATQWEKGWRFQDYEKEQNSLLWQKITSADIPVKDIENLIYTTDLNELKALTSSSATSNKFAQWLSDPVNKGDRDYLLVAKEIEEIRKSMNNPWYYGYDGDPEHKRLQELQEICENYSGKRHASRYGLQLARLYMAQKNYKECIDLWETNLSALPRDIVTDMSASYAGGAYYHSAQKDKAIELFNLSQDIGSLIMLDDWDCENSNSQYKDYRVRELEYIFSRFPNSPLLAIKLQEYIKEREDFIAGYKDWESRDFHDPVSIITKWIGDSLVADDEKDFHDELKQFSKAAINSKKCEQKGMWEYALAYLYFLDGDKATSRKYLNQALRSQNTPWLDESIQTFRILLDASTASNNQAYRHKLLADLKWIDNKMMEDLPQGDFNNSQFYNKYNYSYYYWQDALRKILLGELIPKLLDLGDSVFALQLANYAINRINQVSPLVPIYYYDEVEDRIHDEKIPMDKFRNEYKNFNYFDYSNQFFDLITSLPADDAADYSRRISEPKSELEKFLNDGSYVDKDYINDIVGTLYLREMNYEKAAGWLAKVSAGYQARINIAKNGYFRLDPFRIQSNGNKYIADSTDFKLKFAHEMLMLEKVMNSDSEINRKATAKIRYAVGLRNSFGRCWYLTQYGFNDFYAKDENDKWQTYGSNDRQSFNTPYAFEAYQRVDKLISEGLSEFTDPELAAAKQLEMMNFETIIRNYPDTQAAAYIRGHCDNYSDYDALQ